MKLPAYAPPAAWAACAALALAPLTALAGFGLVVWQWIEPEAALLVLLACTGWVVVEMLSYQRAVDAYNDDYVMAHLGWRAPATLAVLAAQDGTDPATRDFVLGYLQRQLPAHAWPDAARGS